MPAQSLGAQIVVLTSDRVRDLAVIERLSNRPPWSEKLFDDEFRLSHSITFGAMVENHLVGFLVFHWILDDGEIVNLAVDPSCRRRGVSRALMTAALSFAESRSLRRITLEVRKSNEPAQCLYASTGFKQMGIRPGYYADDREDAIIFTHELF